ncbi:hypothetical protein ACSNOK_12425 [Streptomyces sp. URMC 126]
MVDGWAEGRGIKNTNEVQGRAGNMLNNYNRGHGWATHLFGHHG